MALEKKGYKSIRRKKRDGSFVFFRVLHRFCIAFLHSMGIGDPKEPGVEFIIPQKHIAADMG